MRKLLLFVLLGVCFITITYSQSDTIFLKTGEKKLVYEIIKIDNRFVHYKAFEYPGAFITYSKTNKMQIDSCFSNKLKVDSIPDLEFYRKNPYLRQRDYKLSWVQYNMDKFYQQKRLGHWIMAAAIASGTAYVMKPTETPAFGYIAGGLGLISFVIDIDSYKWLKKASLEAKANSVSVTVRF